MSHRQMIVRPAAIRRFDKALLGGVSLLALMMTSEIGQARSLTPGANTVVPTAAAQQAAIAAAQQAAGAAAQAQLSMARAAAALDAARKAQQAAAAIAAAGAQQVPNGLGVGGLLPYGGNANDPLAGIKADLASGNATKWVGANLPTQTTSPDSKVNVDIQQTQQKAILSWETFNVGSNTTVNFKQSASDWIALNRVMDPNAAPSQILGKINAPGAVYIINRNGIIFGAGSQVNVHTLIASSLDIGQLGTDLAARDQYFLNTGIANLNSFSIFDSDKSAADKATLVGGDIKVERGASITAGIATDLVPLGSGGQVYLFGANVHNSGTISAETGEIALVAARTIDVVPNGYSLLPTSVLGTDASGKPLKFRGSEFRISQFAERYQTNGNVGYPNTNQYLAGTGAVTHDGVIVASRGIVVMNGDTVSIDNARDANGRALTDATGQLVQGVISVDTSIDRNSMVLLRAATSVTMNGVISSLPFDDGAAPLPTGGSSGSSVQSFTPAYIEMTAQTNVTVGSTGLIYAPSAQVVLRAVEMGSANGSLLYQATGKDTLGNPIYAQRLFNQGADATGSNGNGDVQSNSSAPQSVLLAPGATVDVSGLQNVELPANYNIIAVDPRAEFADMPLQRSGPLYGQLMYIDIRATGTRADGTTWVGTPLFDASGAIGKVGRSINQLMTVGGSVSMKTDVKADGSGSVQTAGSIVNLAGGSVKFLPGKVNTTTLIGIDGRRYSMANADPNMIYVGIAGQFTVNHAHWGVIETWSANNQIYVPGYTEGHAAGAFSVSTVTPSFGTMYFGSVAGERQIASGQLPWQGSLELITPSSVQIGDTASANYTTNVPKTVLSADTLSGYGLSALTITANDFTVSSGSSLSLAAGGSLSVISNAIDIAGTVTASGGAVSLTTDPLALSGLLGGAASSLLRLPTDLSGQAIAANVFVGGTIDVSGRFVNDTGLTGADIVGPAYINGGSISIKTNKNSDDNRADRTGSILLASGSVLDVSSGGYISPLGKAKLSSDKTKPGVMAGKAGSISLAIYQGTPWISGDVGVPLRPSPEVSQIAVLQLDGRLLGYGFENNGSLRLATADTVRIGGTLQPGETSAIRIGGVASTLPTALLTGGGFGSYTIESVKDDWSGASANIIVSAGTSLTLQQRNLSSTADYSGAASGTKLGQQSAPQLALLGDDQRTPVNLTLKADNILLDTGSTIVTDPKASITLAAVNDDRTLSLTDPTRTVPAQNVDLRGTIVNHGGSVFINALKTHLGSQAVVDLSGTFVANSRFGTVGGPATSGNYIAGGKFSVEAGKATLITNNTYSTPGYEAPQASYVVADAGALVDVSGAAGMVQVMTGKAGTSPVWSWSDAGTVSVDAKGFAWAGGFAASGGRYVGADGQVHSETRANGGTIIVGGGLVMSLRQDMSDVNAAAAAGAPLSLFVSADQLAPFENVYLYAAAGQNGASRIFTDLPGNTYAVSAPAWGDLNISGPLDLNVANRLHIAAGAINAPATAADIRMSAAYVSLTGIPRATSSGNSTLTISGKTIDVEGAGFSGFSQVNLISSGDIRLSTPKIANGIIQGADTTPTENSTFSGKIDTKGNLLLSAQRIYPVTAVDFTIQTPGNVKFAAPAGSKTNIPLSAGGSLTVIANTIEQGGNLFAPLGKITLGNTDETVSSIITQSVVLKAGSLTSVTLADTIVPYGATLDGSTWYYNASLNPLAQPPSKGIVLAGKNVERSDGSTIDLRGGGDLQAQEWIPGKGGSVDTLATTASGQTVYALVPSQGDPVSSVDLHFATSRSPDLGKTMTAGDVTPLAGTQITIDGGNGIPAGTYTLYPAHYATLPGAIRVVYYGDNTGRNLQSGTTLPDGTVLVTGHTTQSTMPGKQSSGQSVFAVRTNAVWQQYSEYSLNGANSYYTQLATKQNITVPRLPMDAGRLAAVALNSIVLNGIALTQPGQDSSGNLGRGSELDISAPKLAVVGHDSYVRNDIPTGYVGLDITQLNGFESVLIGGQRSDTVKGTLITAGADSVVVDTKGEVFSAPEILLVAKVAKPGDLQTIPQTVLTQDGQTVGIDDGIYAPGADSGTVRIATGSVITTKGIVHVGAGRNYYFADPSPVGTATSAQDIATLLGGTLDPTGKIITGVDISKLGYSIRNADGSLEKHAGTLSADDLLKVQNYSYQTTGLGALFVASNDSSLKVSGPSGIAPTSLTIQFAASNDPRLGTLSGGILLPGDAGRVGIATGASITTNTLTLQATASKNSIVGNSSDLHLQQLNLTARSIGLGSPALIFDESAALYNQQFADVKALSLKALSGVITVYGDYNPGSAVTGLTLDAAAIVRAGGAGSAQISLGSGTVTLTNTGTATAPAGLPSADPGAALTVFASDINFGGGTQSILGYGQVKLLAGHGVFVAGSGKTTLGAGDDVVDLSIATPNILVGAATSKGGGSFALTTKGNIAVVGSVTPDGAPVRPADSAETGGSLSFTAANIIVDSTIQAQAGTIALKATGHAQAAANDFGITLASHAYLAAGGYKKTLVDVDTYLAGGKVLLTSDKNNVVTEAHSVIDVAQPSNGAGYGGSIVVTALAGGAALAGDLRGSGGPGLGGGFKLDIKGAADLSTLADQLIAGGIGGAIDIHTRTGNLVLAEGHTLKANAITLTADDANWDAGDATKQFGQVIISGTLNADGYAGKTADGTGQAGGQIGLFGRNAVKLTATGQILARAGGSEGVLDPAGQTSYALPSTIVWFGAGTGADTIRFSVGGRYTTDGGATFTAFAAGAAINLPANAAVMLDAPGTVALASGSAPLHFYAPTHADERGGDVTIGTAWSAAGKIDLQAGSRIDVSGGVKGGLLGGTLTLRAPMDGNNDVKIDHFDAAIAGVRAVNIQSFVTIDTGASPGNVNGIDGSSLTTKNGTKAVWDGYIDPAGAVGSDGKATDFGTWSNVAGAKLNVTNATSGTYTAVPAISVISSDGSQINGSAYVDPTGATFYQVTDPVTGTTFRSSLQVTKIDVTNAGVYTSAPTVTVTTADGRQLPVWGSEAVAKVVMRYNDIAISGFSLDDSFSNRRAFLADNTNRIYATGTATVVNGQLVKVSFDTPAANFLLPDGQPTKIVLSGAGNVTISSDHFSSASLSVWSVTVSGNGSGYSGPVNVNFSGGGATVAATASATMGAAVSITGVTKGYDGANLPTLKLADGIGGATASASFTAVQAGLSGSTDSSHLFVPSVSFIPLATSKVFSGTGDSALLTSSPNQEHQALYTDVLADFVQGKGIQGTGLTGSYGFDNLFARLQTSLVPQLGGSVVHVQPGVELVNSNGSITVASNWNLASGTAGNLQTAINPLKSGQDQTFKYFDPALSYINFNYRLATPWGGLDAGVLTLRARDNINVNASISDGFFQFGDYVDSDYVRWVGSYINTVQASRAIDKSNGLFAYYLNGYGAVPIAPYTGNGNAVSPTSQDLVTADLFPHALRVCTTDCSVANIKTVIAPSSWSYNFTAGAEIASANPNARVALAEGKGDVIVDKHSSYQQALIADRVSAAKVDVSIPTMVRTGTGNIVISAARDVIMNDTTAPGVIYAAGVNTAKLNDPGYSLQTVNGISSVVATNAAGQDLFLEPRVLAYGNNAMQFGADRNGLGGGKGFYYGPPTAAAFPEAGGDVTIDAQRDVIGNVSVGNKTPQYYQPWLLSDVGFAAGTLNTFGAGIFAPVGTQIASQTAWWIQYGSFQQGFLSAGGNITVTAGGDLKDVSVSAPTTGRVSGGLSAGDTPVTHLYGSGNMVVRAGGDILGGSFYEGSGSASIVAGGSIGQNGTVSRYPIPPANPDPNQPPVSPILLPDVPLLAVDTGRLSVVASGSITVAGVVNPAELHAQEPSSANPYEKGSTPSLALYMTTYGPDSKTRLVAGAGDLTITIAPTAVTDSTSNAAINAASSIYPASFEALALNGSLITTGIRDIAGDPNIPSQVLPKASIPMPGIILSPSEHGTFLLLAQDDVDLTFGYPKNPKTLYGGTPRPYFSAGASLIDSAFDPFQPNSGFADASTGIVLAHANDPATGLDTIARIYAVTGDITATGKSAKAKGFTSDENPLLQRVEINRPARVFAGRDIVDLNIVVQNIHTGDVSSIEAGRNISYTGYNNAGGLQVAGPGFFVVQAGGDIGPFVPAAHNNAVEADMQEGIASVGNATPTAVGNITIPGTAAGSGSIGIYDTALLGPKDNPRRNSALTDAAGTRQGADILTLFGTKFGVDYQAVISAYINPANASGVDHNYLPELRAFLARIGKPAADDKPETLFAAFNALPKALQQVFVDQVFFAELKSVGTGQKSGTAESQRGYRMIETMFPSSLGYTANALGGGANGAAQLVKTGDLNVLHASIQTRLGGDISIFGPGGNLIVGSLGTETNSALKLSDIGILTLGGGAINSFTDASVLVNSSRVLTTQGGDVLIWSSNGNIDAGRGSKTILSAPALQVLYDQNDYQSIDLGGFVTGSGIGTVQGSSLAEASQLYLLAPRGTIDFGTAGVRATGDAVFVAPVIANASNFQVQGSTSGIPVISVPNIGALTSSSNTAGAASKSAETPTAGGSRAPASIFIVEIIGHGGGDGQEQSSPDDEKKSDEEKKKSDKPAPDAARP